MKKANYFEFREQSHYRKDSPKLKNKRGKQLESSVNVVNRFINSDGNDSARKILSVSSNHRQNSWILDTGATYSMCLHKNWFFTYKQMSGKVFLGNNLALSMEGIGKIRLGMFDGVVRTIECWHVPELKRNLMSLGTLDSYRFRYNVENGVLKVYKASMVLMKSSLVSRLCFLQGSQFQGKLQ